MIEVYFTKNHPDAILPKYASEQAAGFDLRTVDQKILLPGDRAVFDTGLSWQLETSNEYDLFELQIRPRSGLAAKHGVTVLNSPGTVDQDYRGSIGVILINLGKESYHVASGERIAQGVVAPVRQVAIYQRQSLDKTARNNGGFGSTGRF